jgi:hypothetical protein
LACKNSFETPSIEVTGFDLQKKPQNFEVSGLGKKTPQILKPACKYPDLTNLKGLLEML